MMIQLDFSTYMNKNIEVDEEKKKNIIDRLYQDKMAGFINNIIEETGLDLLNTLRVLDLLKRRRLVQETFQNYYCRYM